MRRTARTAADGVGARGWLEMGWGEEAAGDERPWLRGRLRTANGCGELRGWLRTAVVQRSGWKWVGEGKGRKREGKGRERKGKEGQGRERKGKDGKGRERKGKDRKGTEKDGKGRERNGADGCRRRGCKGVAGNVWGEEAAGDERPWLRGTAADGKWVRRTAWTAADGVGGTEWLEMGGEKKPLVMSELGCADGCGRRAREWLGNGWRRSRW